MHNTVTYARIPEGKAFQLYLRLDTSYLVCVRYEGTEPFRQVLETGSHVIPLYELLNQQKSRRRPGRFNFLSGFFAPGGKGEPAPAFLAEITVVIADPEEGGAIRTTFDFQCLPPIEYDRAYSRHLDLSPAPNPRRDKVLAGAELRLSLNQCWNCSHPLTAASSKCEHCGAEQSEEIAE